MIKGILSPRTEREWKPFMAGLEAAASKRKKKKALRTVSLSALAVAAALVFAWLGGERKEYLSASIPLKGAPAIVVEGAFVTQSGASDFIVEKGASR